VSTQNPRWEAVPFELSYRLGEITFFRKRFRGLALSEHFFDLGDDPDKPRPPFESFAAGIQVIVTRSHPVRDTLPVLAAREGALRYVPARYTRFHTDLSGDFDRYLKKFSAKTRNTLRRKVRRFLEAGDGCEMRTYKRPEEMEEFHGFARQVSALSYQERLLDAGIPMGKQYVAELIRLAATDSVRGYVLFLHRKPIAYLCCPAINGVLLYRYLGYDPMHADLSPGAVLQYLAFESLFPERRFRAFDFTEGQGEHKRFFGTHATDCATICYFRSSFSAHFWIGLHRFFNYTSSAIAALLDKIGVKAKLKRIIRRYSITSRSPRPEPE
jgi:hypothetical protein